MEESRKKDTIKLIIIALIVMMLIIVVISYTYSFFQVEEANTTVIKGKVFSVNLSLEVNKITPSTELGLIPQLDSAITSAVVGKNNKSCIDDIGNEICQVYEIKVKNTSNVKLRVDGVVELNKGNNTKLKWARISNAVTEKVTAKPTLLSDINEPSYTTLTVNEEYTSGTEKKYYIVVWISETGNTQSDSGDFSGVVKFKISEEITPSSRTLYALNLVSEIDTPNFTKTSCSEGCGEAPVGLITADELVLAGERFSTVNNKFYLYIGRSYCTMSPYSFSDSSVSSLVFRMLGSGELNNQYVRDSSGVRPVISLKANVIKYGNGSKEQPFRISE